MAEFFRLRARSFRYAFAGWWYVIRTQRNAWIHAVISVAVLVLGLFLRLPARDFAVLIAALASIIVGLLILGPPLWAWLRGITGI